MRYTVYVLIALSFALWSCSETFTPKPKAYPRVIYPERSYQMFTPKNCPFQFEKPSYSKIEKDSLFFNEKTENNCWIDLQMPHFNSTLHMSYKEISTKNTFDKLLEDAHKLTSKHTLKAEYIEDEIFTNQYGVGGMLYNIGGNTASSFQFFMTDSTSHFLRGSLYFRNTPNSDSLRPILKFIKEDLHHLISTFKWNDSPYS